MAALVFDTAAANREMLGAEPTTEETQQVPVDQGLVFDVNAAAQEAVGAPDPDSPEDPSIDYSPEMRKLLGLPPKGEPVMIPPTVVGGPQGTSQVVEDSSKEGGDILKVVDPDPQRIAESTNPLLRGTLRSGIVTEADEERAVASGKDLTHRLKLAGETAIISTADFADFALKVDNWRKGGGFELPKMELNGEVLSQASWAEAARWAITETYGLLGSEKTLEEREDVGDIGVGLLAENLGPAGAVKLFQSGLKRVLRNEDKAQDFLSTLNNNFIKKEAAIGTSGAAAGTVAAAITPGELEERKAVAELANLFGIGAHVMFDVAPTVTVARRLWKKKAEVEDFLEDGRAYDMAEQKVNKFIASLVPEEEVASVQERMRIVREVQRLYPDFKPTVGNVIGTEEARKIQRMTDSVAYERATAQYLKTKAAVEQMVKDLQTVTDPSQHVKIAGALQLYAKETSTHLTNMRDEIMRLEDAARSVDNMGYRAAESGTTLRKQLLELKDQYRKQRDELYDNIDPEETIRFSPGPLLIDIENLSNSTDIEKMVDASETGYDFLAGKLPQIVRQLRKRGAEEGQEYLSFSELHKMRKLIGRKAFQINQKDPTSNVPNVLGDIKDRLDEVIENRMISGDPEVVTRYQDAKKFYQEEYLPKFQQGVGGDLLELRSRGDYQIRPDAVGEKFWRPGNKEANLEEFNQIFSMQEVAKLGRFNDDATELAIETARHELKKHALKTLEDELIKPSNTSRKPIDVLNDWKHRYRGSLQSFDDITEAVAKKEQELIDLEAVKFSNTEISEKLTNNIINKYLNEDASTLIPKLFSGTPEETGRRFQDILRAASRKSSGDFDERFPVTITPSSPEELERVRELTHAVKEGMLQHMMKKSYQPKLGMVNWESFDNFLSKTHTEHLKEVFTEAEVESLHNFRDALKIMGSETKPVVPAELNKVKEFFDDLGFAPASVLSRYYSHQLGKVGGLYLFVDGVTRVFTKTSDKYFKRAYENTMYDLDALENVLKQVGSTEAADTAADLRAGLKAQFKTVGPKSAKEVRNFIVNFFQGHKALAQYKIFDAVAEAQEGTVGQLSDNYLLMNDSLTGQPSRLVEDLDDGVTEAETDAEIEAILQGTSDPREEEDVSTPESALAAEPVSQTVVFDDEEL